ncbi:ribonuclease P protein component [Humidisolicoccus flavus]|uniref:ribonuclease P protein component n=1 Tax=Humidisolicoccus flavus TaxID=3111414 RepID=UPI00324D9334
MALPTANRVKAGEDFRRITRTGRRVRTPFAIVSIATPGTSESRFGFVVSKKVGNAVVRNRLRRRLSEIVRAELPLGDPHDVVVRVLPAGADADFDTLKSVVVPILRSR